MSDALLALLDRFATLVEESGVSEELKHELRVLAVKLVEVSRKLGFQEGVEAEKRLAK